MDDYQDQAKWYRVAIEGKYLGDYDTRPDAVQAVADYVTRTGTWVDHTITRTRGQEDGN